MTLNYVKNIFLNFNNFRSIKSRKLYKLINCQNISAKLGNIQIIGKYSLKNTHWPYIFN